MSNAVTTARGTALSTSVNPWEEASQGAGGFVGKFAKFSGKTGDFTAGQDEDELELGTQIIVDFNLITRGYKCWVDEKMVEEVSNTIVSGIPLPKVSDLTNHGPYEKHDDGSQDGWQETHTVPFIIDPEYDADANEAFLFQTSSGGGLRALKKLYKDYGKVFQSKIDDEGNYMFPLIELDNESYKPKEKKRGTIYNPIFKIVDWLTAEDVGERLALLAEGGSSDSEDAGEDEAPARGRGRVQKAEAEEDTSGIEPEDHGAEEPASDEAPARGRRARAKRFG